MIPRYVPRDFAELWSDVRRYETWFEVELAAAQSMEAFGVVPVGTVERIRGMGVRIDPRRVEEIEGEVHHDVIAFLTHIEELVGESARWLHLGMTSSDVLDTAGAVLMRRAVQMLIERLERLMGVVAVRAREHAHCVMMGRSHGVHAEPITFGLALAGHHAEFVRCRDRLRVAMEEVSVGKISGAVGTYVHLSPEVEVRALESLGLRPETVSTQVVARDRHAALFSAMALVAAAVERFATNVRHWQRTEVGEVEEPFARGQKGSSAMPHKRNPIGSENLCGLARIVRSAVVPALENVVLWHERDISHSSVERVIVPDVTSVLAFMLDRMTRMVEGLVVRGQNLLANVERTGGLFFSENVLLKLVSKGIARQEAYVWVQRNAMRSMQEGEDFFFLLSGDLDVARCLTVDELRSCFDVDWMLRYVDVLIERGLRV